MSARRKFGHTLVTLACLHIYCTLPRVFSHPLDQLSPAEIRSARQGVAHAGFAYPQFKIYTIDLAVPPKADVVAWGKNPTAANAPSREANLWLRQLGATDLWIINIDVSKPSTPGILVSKRIQKNVQPPMRGDSGEMLDVITATLEDPAVIEALARRGLTSDEVLIDYDSVGNYPGITGISPREASFEFYLGLGDNLYGLPLGMKALVDVDKKIVISVYDRNRTAAELPPKSDADINPPSRPDPPRPFRITRPQGVSYHLDGQTLKWQRWQFHVRPDWRVGVIVSMVRYNDSFTGRVRSIAHELFLSEMFVPYQLGDAQWYYRTFLDAGEFGMGSDANELSSAECGGGDAVFFDLNDVTLDGTLAVQRSAVCVFERWTGDPLWLQGQVCASNDTAAPCAPKETRSGVELVVRTVPRVGNYDYVCDMIFRLDGSIKFKVGATGVDAMREHTPGEESRGAGNGDGGHSNAGGGGGGGEDRLTHEAQMTGFVAAPYHDHFFNYRLDVDVDGQDNTLVVGTVKQYTPVGVPRPTMWGIDFQNISCEADGKRDLDAAMRHPEVWTLQASSSGRIDPLTLNAPGYALIPGSNAKTLMEEGDPLLERAAFMKHVLWATPFRASERFAAGDWPNQRAGGKDGLDVWAKQNRSIEDTDVVLWYSVGFHHVTLQENMPVLPTYWGAEFDLMPANFFKRNPAIDQPAARRSRIRHPPRH